MTTSVAGDVERLGSTHAWGQLLLQLLELGGWTVTVRPLFCDSGVLVLAERDRVVIYRKGASVADVACDLFTEATRRRPSVRSPAPATR